MNNTNWFKVGFLAGLGLIASVAAMAIGLWSVGVVGDAADKISAEADIKRAQAKLLKAQVENAQAQAIAYVQAPVQAQARTQASRVLGQTQPLADQVEKQTDLVLQLEGDLLVKEMINNLVTDKTICIFQRVGDSLGIEWNVPGAKVVLYQDGTPIGLRISIASGMEAQTYTYKLVALGADKSVVTSRTLILKVNPKDAPVHHFCDDTTALDTSDPRFR